MKLHLLHTATLFCLAVPAFSADPMTAEEFDSFTRNRTLEYHTDGTAVGAEVFQDGQRVIWSRGAGECVSGHWYAAGPQICFVYDGDPEPHCWSFHANGNRLTALFEAQPEQIDSYEVLESSEPVFCPGVDIEV